MIGFIIGIAILVAAILAAAWLYSHTGTTEPRVSASASTGNKWVWRYVRSRNGKKVKVRWRP